MSESTATTHMRTDVPHCRQQVTYFLHLRMSSVLLDIKMAALLSGQMAQAFGK